MAKPQAENGHVDIANEIAEALCRINLSAYESRVLWALFRKTYGWHKKSDRISYTQWEQLTGLKRWHIARTIKQLIARNIITSRGNGYNIEYSFQKDHEGWTGGISGRQHSLPVGVTTQSLPKGVEPLPLGVGALPKGVTNPLPVGVNTKEKKETIQKKLHKRKVELPEYIDKDLWDDFIDLRTRLKAVNTERAIDALLKRLDEFHNAGADPNEALRQSIMNSWKGVFPLKGGQGGAHKQSSRQLRPRDTYTDPKDL